MSLASRGKPRPGKESECEFLLGTVEKKFAEYRVGKE